MKVPSFYEERKWIDSAGQMPLAKRLDRRIEEIKRKLPNMTLKEKQELWLSEPYWEITNLVIKSEDFTFPKA